MTDRGLPTTLGVLRRIGLSVMFAFLILAMMQLPASAAAMTPTQTAQAHANDVNRQKIGGAVQKLTPYVARAGDGTFSLVVPDSVAKTIDPTWLAGERVGVARLNALISQGVLKSTPAGDVYSPTGSKFNIQADSTGGPYTYWWGQDYNLSNHDTQVVEGIITGGGGVGAIIAVFGSMTAGIAVGVLAIAVGGLLICNASGQGVTIHTPWTGPPWCTSQ